MDLVYIVAGVRHEIIDVYRVEGRILQGKDNKILNVEVVDRILNGYKAVSVQLFFDDILIGLHGWKQNILKDIMDFSESDIWVDFNKVREYPFSIVMTKLTSEDFSFLKTPGNYFDFSWFHICKNCFTCLDNRSYLKAVEFFGRSCVSCGSDNYDLFLKRSIPNYSRDTTYKYKGPGRLK